MKRRFYVHDNPANQHLGIRDARHISAKRATAARLNLSGIVSRYDNQADPSHYVSILLRQAFQSGLQDQLCAENVGYLGP